MHRIRALITGTFGQDGAYLAKLLLDNGYQVFGGYRGRRADRSHLKYVGIESGIDFVALDFERDDEIQGAINQIKPDLIFNLAAVSSLELSESNPQLTRRVNYEAPRDMFTSAIEKNPSVRIFQASSALVFGAANEFPQTERTPRNPDTEYGRAKNDLDRELARLRECGIFAVSGILFNHESPLRGANFISQKVVTGLAGLKHGVTETPLSLGNMGDVRDWSHAADFARGILQSVRMPEPDEYVFASGRGHEVRDWITISADYLGFHPEFVTCDGKETAICRRTGQVLAQTASQFTRMEAGAPRIGDPTKLRNIGWSPDITFQRLVIEMTRAAYDKLKS